MVEVDIVPAIGVVSYLSGVQPKLCVGLYVPSGEYAPTCRVVMIPDYLH